MTIAFQASAAAEATTVTLPVHRAGDLLLMVSYKSTNNPATIPSGWFSCSNANFNGIAGNTQIAFKIAASSSETSGTWTSAEFLVCAVYRPTTNYHYATIAPLNRVTSSVQVNLTQKSANSGVNSGAAVNLQAASSVVVGVITTNDRTALINGTRTALTLRADHQGTSSNRITIYDTGSSVSACAFNSFSLGSAITSVNGTIELLDSGIAIASAGKPTSPFNQQVIA